ncbi:type I-C CRISPR-associated protein Cas5c [Acetobacter tropicalis]|uniref:pre-crRNA processing endonuclease n=1 Tax=Acetobacter tropicalis TaxID=104102 RepID=A0A149TXW5_9PROT|nr:type I-C CRISPR-associated protein Cas5c [Acetobacter tropicalis]KXV57968.1 CRISPR-associated protein [Acetobacter tropicalis]OUI87064.1 CRISPR-associated protein [Acetobacter tropicalis]
MGVRLHIWGERACFTRPEFKSERVSYDVITPSAARGILEAIHWKPAIRWHIDRIHVLKPIQFGTIRRNEVGAKANARNAATAMKAGRTDGLGLSVEENRQQRAATILLDVAYVIEAHFTMTEKAGPGETAAKHISIFNRRAEAGQCFHRPCLGTREFAADFALLPDGAPLPTSTFLAQEDAAENIDLGWMLHDIDFAHGNVSRFFRAHIRNGVIEVPPADSPELAA